MSLILGFGLFLCTGIASAKPNNQPASDPLTANGDMPQHPAPQTEDELNAQYTEMLSALRAEIKAELPLVDESKKIALQQTHAEKNNAENIAAEAQRNVESIYRTQALVNHAKGKWIKDADKEIATALADIKAAKTPAEREAAEKELAKWEANRTEGVKALEERALAYEKSKQNQAQYKQASQATQAALVQACENEMNAAKALLPDISPVVASDKLDAKLVKGALLAHATPRGLAVFARDNSAKAALVNQLLGDTTLMKDMLVAGGARFGDYGRAMEIYTEIRKASIQSHSGNLQRLALGTSLEHARPIVQSSPKDASGNLATVDPVKRYLHYEKAFMDGELDTAFKDFTAWEYRHVVHCDAPDEILTWGRTMLRNYRPDHIYYPNHEWRYVGCVNTDVKHGSQNVQDDDPALHNYQNIIRNGGGWVRRALFGRFILRSFGIPTWGVTQKADGALSHWTPSGWVVNLGGGFNMSWWDKDDVPMSGTQFFQETQARAEGDAYLPVLRAQWVSRILGEEPYNDRRKVTGGFWSNMAHYMTSTLAAKQDARRPFGGKVREDRLRMQKQKEESAELASLDQEVQVAADGVITIPSAAHQNASGKVVAMKSHAGGVQLYVRGGYKNQYVFDVPEAGPYQLTARVVTVRTGQKFRFTTNDTTTPVETDVPYTLGMWDHTKPVEVILAKGENTLHFESVPGSEPVIIKDFLLKPSEKAKNPQWPWWLALFGLLPILLVAVLRKHGQRTSLMPGIHMRVFTSSV